MKLFEITYFFIEIKINSQNQYLYCLKNVTESDGFQNHPSMGETVKIVILISIDNRTAIKKKHTHFPLQWLTLRPEIHIWSKWNINFEYLKIYESGKMKVMKYAVFVDKFLSL